MFNSVDSKSSLVQVMAQFWNGDKPLPEPMLTKFSNVYIHPYGSSGLNGLNILLSIDST